MRWPWRKPVRKEAPADPRSGATAEGMYDAAMQEAIEDTVYPQTDEKDVEDIALLEEDE